MATCSRQAEAEHAEEAEARRQKQARAAKRLRQRALWLIPRWSQHQG